MLALREQIGKGNYRTGMENHHTVKHSAYSVTVYTYCYIYIFLYIYTVYIYIIYIYVYIYIYIVIHTVTAALFHFPINSIHVPNGPVGTDQFLRLSLGQLGRHKSVQKQVELQIDKKWNFSNKPRRSVAKLFKSGKTKEMPADGHCDRSC
jgi:hypothetical protein